MLTSAPPHHLQIWSMVFFLSLSAWSASAGPARPSSLETLREASRDHKLRLDEKTCALSAIERGRYKSTHRVPLRQVDWTRIESETADGRKHFALQADCRKTPCIHFATTEFATGTPGPGESSAHRKGSTVASFMWRVKARSSEEADEILRLLRGLAAGQCK